MKNTEIFTKNLVRIMRREDTSQRELARRANLSDAAVSRYVQGKRFPRSKAMVELSKALNCSVKDLIEDLTQESTESLKERKKLQIDRMKNTEIFSGTLVRMMRREDISQKELARRANLSQPTISNYVNGIRFPEPKAMIELSKALNCSIEDLTQEPTESELESIIKKAISSLNESERNFLISELRMVRSKKIP